MRPLSFMILLGWLAACTESTPQQIAENSLTPKVLVIGIDGIRPDVLMDVTILDDFKSYLYDQEIDVNTDGEKELEKAKEKILSLDSTNMDLTHAFDFVETFIIDREATLYDKEVDLIKRRLFLEMIGIMKGSEFRIKESIKDDPIVIKAKEILQDPIAYTSSFIPDQETKTISN